MVLGGNIGKGGKPLRLANRVFVNQDGRFVERAESLGLSDHNSRTRSAFWLDADGDGNLDALLAKVGPGGPSEVVFRQNAEGFEACEMALPGLTEKDSMNFAQRARLFSDDREHLIPHRYFFSDHLYRFGEDCRFEAVSLDDPPKARHVADLVTADLSGNLLNEIFLVTARAHEGLGLKTPRELRAAFSLVSGPRSVDFRASDPITVQVLPKEINWWPNATLAIGASGREPEERPFVLSASNPDNHGLTEPAEEGQQFRIGYLPEEKHWRIVIESDQWSAGSFTITSDGPVEVLKQNIQHRDVEPYPDVLLRQEGMRLLEATEGSGLDHVTACHSVAAGDFDNDMDLDLYIVCSDAISNLPNRLYENLGDGRFRLVPTNDLDEAWAGLGDNASLGDFDNDGFLDLFVTNGRSSAFNDGGHRLLRNRGNDNAWLQVELEGTRSNRDAYGSRVFLTAGGRTQVRDKRGDMRAGVQDQQLVQFGLGSNNEVEELIVQWPDGALERFPKPAVRQRLILREGDGELLDFALFSARRSYDTGEAVIFLAVPGKTIDDTMFRWTFGDRQSVVGPAVMRHRYLSKGAYDVKVGFRDQDGQRRSISMPITVQ